MLILCDTKLRQHCDLATLVLNLKKRIKMKRTYNRTLRVQTIINHNIKETQTWTVFTDASFGFRSEESFYLCPQISLSNLQQHRQKTKFYQKKKSLTL